MAYLSQVVYINEEDYSTLLSEGEITKGGETYEYDESALYIIKDVSVPEYATRSGYAATAGTSTMAVNDGSGNNIVQTYGKKPLVIEVNDSDVPFNLPNGTYDSVTQALSNGREVFIKYRRDEDDNNILYCRLSDDYTYTDNSYFFYEPHAGLLVSLSNLNYVQSWYASPNYHSHGNINKNGQLSTTATIANNDKLVITDNSNSNAIKASSISFDGSTTTQALTKKGTWENVVNSVNGQTGQVSLALGDTNVIETVKVNNTALTPVSKAVNIMVPTKVSDLANDSNFTSNVGTITGITMNGVSKGTNGVVDLGTVITEHQDISGKADKATTLAEYGITDAAPLASPTLTGIPSAPTAALSTNNTQIATTAFVKSAIADLANTAPSVLQALQDLASALSQSQNDPITTMMDLLGQIQGSIPTLVHLTQTEYDNLSAADKNNGSWYFIEEE